MCYLYLTHIFTFDFQYTHVQLVQLVNSTHHNPYHYHRRYSKYHCIVFSPKAPKGTKNKQVIHYGRSNYTFRLELCTQIWNRPMFFGLKRRWEMFFQHLLSIDVVLNLKSVNLQGCLQVHRLWLGIQCRRGGSAPGHHPPPPPHPHHHHHHHCHPNPKMGSDH